MANLIPKFTLDFAKEKLGMPHQMRFGAYSLYSKSPENKNMAELSK
jgi:selenium-binding protein 1